MSVLLVGVTIFPNTPQLVAIRLQTLCDPTFTNFSQVRKRNPYNHIREFEEVVTTFRSCVDAITLLG